MYLSVVELSVDVDLSLSDVPGEVGDWMGNVVVGHSQNGNLKMSSLNIVRTGIKNVVVGHSQNGKKKCRR